MGDYGDDIMDVEAIRESGVAAGAEGPPPIRAGQMLSISKLQAAGFCDVVDSEDMLIEMLTQLQEQRVLPK